MALLLAQKVAEARAEGKDPAIASPLPASPGGDVTMGGVLENLGPAGFSSCHLFLTWLHRGL